MFPRILISSPASSSGKTTLACALARIFSEGMRVCAFKAGPDFIDPMFHAEAGAVPGANLDLFFSSADDVRGIFARYAVGADLCVVEGAMGLFDGVSGGMEASAADVSRAISAPVVLVVDAKGKGFSLCAEIWGYLNFRKDVDVRGVVLNRCSGAFYSVIAPKIRSECSVEVLGFIEENPDFSVGSRHLGLVTPKSVGGISEKIERIASSVKKSVDVERILQIANSAQDLAAQFSSPFPKEQLSPRVSIAVTRDEAFCFCYRENLDLLSAFGARIEFFSPLEDEPVPPGCSALYITGGYPELFMGRLSDNRISAASVRAFCRSGAPVLAECGGFLYLQMLGILPGSFSDAGRLVRFGYAEFGADEDSFLLERGGKIRGHEFHHFDTSENGSAFTARRPSGASWRCVQVAAPASPAARPPCLPAAAFERNVVAGFPHFYFPSNPKAAENLVNAALLFESLRAIPGGCAGCGRCASRGKAGVPTEV